MNPPASPQKASRFSRSTLQKHPATTAKTTATKTNESLHASSSSLHDSTSSLLSSGSSRHYHHNTNHGHRYSSSSSRRGKHNHGSSSSSSSSWSTRRAVLFVFAVAMSFTVVSMARIMTSSSILHDMRHAEEHHAPMLTTTTTTTTSATATVTLTTSSSNNNNNNNNNKNNNIINQQEEVIVQQAALQVAQQAVLNNIKNNDIIQQQPPPPSSSSVNWNKLPQWLQQYFQWHHQQRQHLTAHNWNATSTPKFLVMTALRGKTSGGITDRLRPVPSMLRLAAQSHRILLVYWERPCALEEFLQPPVGGLLDWRVPEYMREAVSHTPPVSFLKQLSKNAGKPDAPRIFNTMYQSYHYGEQWFDEQGQHEEGGALPVREIFRDIWHAVFVPSPPVQALIDQNLQQLHLTPGEFATAHLRVTHGKDGHEKRHQDQLPHIVENAMNCVSNLRPGGPFFVASDSPLAVALAQQYGAHKGVSVKSAAHPHAPIHVDFHNESDTSLGPASFYNGFVDMYLLAATRCVAVGPGGFARWGDLLGYGDQQCVIHHHGRKAQTCQWKDGPNGGGGGGGGGGVSAAAAVPPTTTIDSDATDPHVVDVAAVAAVEQHFPHNLPNTHNNVWEESALIPQWLKDYFAWHQQQRAVVNATNWQSHRYLIMTAKKGQHNGGMTDRIRPLPAFLRIAATSKRIFMIQWDRPFPLEEFLLPPRGGLDWRVPSYMQQVVTDTKPRSNFDPILKAATKPEPAVLTTVYQSWHYGELYYKEQTKPGETDIYTAFRDIWNVVFTPSPPVSQRIHANFERMGIVPGEFATAHMRVLYKVKDRPAAEIEPIVHNAMNCVSNLRPGGPYFVASDSLVAIQMAIDYGRARNVTVVSATHEHQPLHVDFHNESDTSVTPGDFFDGFVDMYLMAATRCVAVGPGGFARWGNLLGYDASCVKHANGRKAETCQWTEKPKHHDAYQYPQQIPAFRPPMTETSGVY